VGGVGVHDVLKRKKGRRKRNLPLRLSMSIEHLIVYLSEAGESHALQVIRAVTNVNKISAVEDCALGHYAVSGAVGWVAD